MSRKQIKIMVFAGGLGLAAAAAAGLIPARAPAFPQDEFQPLRDNLASFDSFYATARVARKASAIPSLLPPSKLPFIIRADASGRVVADLQSGNWRYLWDGANLWSHKDYPQGSQPSLAGPAVDAIFADLWTELRTGFANSQWSTVVPDDYPEVGLRSTQVWRLVELPHDWADDFWLFLGVSEATGDLRRVVVWDISAERLAKVDGMYMDFPTDVTWNVPIEPNLDDPARLQYGLPNPPHWRQYGSPELTYHETQTRFQVPYVPEESTGLVYNEARPQHWVAACTAPDTTQSESFLLIWRAETWSVRYDEAADALANCTNQMRMRMMTQFRVPNGSSARITGTLTVEEQGPGGPNILRQADFDQVKPGPIDTSFVRTFEWPMSDDVDLDGLTIRLEGTIEATCGPTVHPQGKLRVGMDNEHQPTLSWPGCYL